MRRKLKTILSLFLLLFVVALVWGGWYVNRKGFNRHWRQFVNSEFEKRGLSVSISRLTLDPFHGLVARDVEIYDVKSHHRTLAVISQIVLDINYSNLFRHKPFLNGLDLRDTTLVLPLDPSNPTSPRIQITKLNARVQLPPSQFYLSKADANVLIGGFARFPVEMAKWHHYLAVKRWVAFNNLNNNKSLKINFTKLKKEIILSELLNQS